MLQYSFDRNVRTCSPAFHPFAQDSIDLFRREKPERIGARRTGPMICHGTIPRLDSARRTGCLGVCSTPVTHGCCSEAYFPRRRSSGIGPKTLIGHALQSPALDRPSSLLGKAASAQGPDTARNDLQTVKYLACGRNIGQPKKKLRKGPRNYGAARFASSTADLPTSGRFGSYCDRRILLPRITPMRSQRKYGPS